MLTPEKPIIGQFHHECSARRVKQGLSGRSVQLNGKAAPIGKQTVWRANTEYIDGPLTLVRQNIGAKRRAL